MNPVQLVALRKFLACIEPQLPQATAIMYSRLPEAIPEAKQLFKGDPQELQERWLHMLREIVKLTRSSHLWPVLALTGTASIPAVDKLGSFHSCRGVSREHFGKMKAVLVQCFREYCPEQFNPQAEEALGFIFDVLAKASTNACGIDAEVIARKNQLPHQNETVEPGSFAGFFGAGVLDEASQPALGPLER
jgi:hemoglobin-like flavoprotein